MPKVHLRNIDKYEEQIKNNLLLIKGNKSEAKLAEQMGLKQRTVSNRLQEPLNMRLSEVILLCEKNHINVSDFVGKALKMTG